MKRITLLSIMILAFFSGLAQDRYFTRTGEISFYSDAPLEKIEAFNQQASCILDKNSGDVAVSLQVRGFKFEKALMEEHFNENYMESHKFPKSTFKGTILDIGSAGLDEPGKHEVRVQGDLTIHGVTRPIETKGVIETTPDGFTLSSAFTVSLADYKIDIPSAVTGKIAETVKISLEMALTPYSN